ncbi:hypothetical protein Vretifemale_17136, partial [Volvox reticuliferus]
MFSCSRDSTTNRLQRGVNRLPKFWQSPGPCRTSFLPLTSAPKHLPRAAESLLTSPPAVHNLLWVTLARRPPTLTVAARRDEPWVAPSCSAPSSSSCCCCFLLFNHCCDGAAGTAQRISCSLSHSTQMYNTTSPGTKFRRNIKVAECVQLPAEDDGGLQMRAATAALLQGRVTADKEDEKVRREAAEAAAAELRAVLAEEGARREAAEASTAEMRTALAEEGARREAAEASTAEMRTALAE